MAKGGKSLNDREKSAKVRDKVLDTILSVYAGKKVSGKKWELTLRMATIVLPRLNEHTGDGGGPLRVEISETIARKHDLTPSPKTDSQ